MNGVQGRSGGARHIAGNPDKTPEDAGPQKPKGMPVEQAKAWDMIVAALPESSLRQIDAILLFTLSAYVAAVKKINKAFLKNPADPDIRQAYNQYNQKIIQLSTVFGLSPADRKRIAIGDGPKAEEDDLKELLKQFGNQS